MYTCIHTCIHVCILCLCMYTCALVRITFFKHIGFLINLILIMVCNQFGSVSHANTRLHTIYNRIVLILIVAMA